MQVEDIGKHLYQINNQILLIVKAADALPQGRNDRTSMQKCLLSLDTFLKAPYHLSNIIFIGR